MSLEDERSLPEALPRARRRRRVHGLPVPPRTPRFHAAYDNGLSPRSAASTPSRQRQRHAGRRPLQLLPRRRHRGRQRHPPRSPELGGLPMSTTTSSRLRLAFAILIRPSFGEEERTEAQISCHVVIPTMLAHTNGMLRRRIQRLTFRNKIK